MTSNSIVQRITLWRKSSFIPARRCSASSRTFPQLPSELLHEVFKNLKVLWRHLLRPELPLDLFACSLVCRLWYNEALSLLPPAFFHRFLFRYTIYQQPYSSATLQRAHSLLLESRRLGLDYVDRIQELEITHVLYDTEAHHALFNAIYPSILSLQPTNLRSLHLEIPNASITIPSSSKACSNQFYFFLKKLAPLCTQITHLDLYAPEGRYYFPEPAKNPVLNPFASLLPRLTSLRLSHVPYNCDLIKALQLCVQLREVSYRSPSPRLLVVLVASWHGLRRCCVESWNNDGHVDELVLALAHECQLLEAVEVHGKMADISTHVSGSTMAKLLEQCKELKEVVVWVSAKLNDTFLDAMVKYGRRLERVEMVHCSRIIGKSVEAWIEDAVCWPELRRFAVPMCWRLWPEFIERIVKDAPKLAEVCVVGKAAAYGGCEGVLVEYAFEAVPECEGVWVKKMISFDGMSGK